MFTVFGVTIVLYFIKILSGSRNFWIVMSHVKLTPNDLTDLVNLQRHKHFKTCKKRGYAVCRFNFPLPLMPRTMIQQPLSETELDENVADSIVIRFYQSRLNHDIC